MKPVMAVLPPLIYITRNAWEYGVLVKHLLIKGDKTLCQNVCVCICIWLLPIIRIQIRYKFRTYIFYPLLQVCHEVGTTTRLLPQIENTNIWIYLIHRDRRKQRKNRCSCQMKQRALRDGYPIE